MELVPGPRPCLQRLTRKYGGDPKSWNQVASFLLKKSDKKFYNDPVVEHGYCRGTEPVSYVKFILNRYKFYQKLIPDEQS